MKSLEGQVLKHQGGVSAWQRPGPVLGRCLSVPVGPTLTLIFPIEDVWTISPKESPSAPLAVMP